MKRLLPSTYRDRLLVYTVLLVVFLFVVIGFSYESNRSAILRQANLNVERVANQVSSHFRSDVESLSEYLQMIQGNAEFLEYMFIVANVDTDPTPIASLFKRQFGWMPVNKAMIISHKGDVIYGSEHTESIKLITEHIRESEEKQVFYTYNNGVVYLIAMAGIFFQGEYIGTVAVTHNLDHKHISHLITENAGHLFFVKNGVILLSTYGELSSDNIFRNNGGRLTIKDTDFLVHPVALVNAQPEVPEIWLGLHEEELMNELDKNRSVMLIASLLGASAITIIGFMILHNFTTPLVKLTRNISEIENGVLPDIKEIKSATDEISMLHNHFARMVESLREKQKTIKEAHLKLEEQAATDVLTGLYNRRHLYDLFPKLHAEASRTGAGIVVLLCDLDHFKKLNDEFGHLCGDECLRHFAKILEQCSRTSDFIFRMGGEEFLILSIGSTEGALVLAEKVRKTLEENPANYGGRQIKMTVSIGVSHSEGKAEGDTLSHVIRGADVALYKAKDEGRNRISVAGTIH
ncbi:MAG: diguanylate cyclase [Gammaproteobacteria bacterium]|nr:diguanylate cyclase [Gammaproteobacteria bacterium]